MKSSDKHTDKDEQSFPKNLPSDLQETWDLFGSAPRNSESISSVETEEALSNVWDKIEPKKKIDNPILKNRWITTIAATLLLAALTSVFLFSEVKFQAPSGEQLQVMLADGSTVLLNGNSSLSYPRSYGLIKRTVSINGEAYFDVESSDKPFIVHAPTTMVEVLGTKFTVLDWKESKYTKPSIMVEEGKVAVSAYTDDSYQLVKDEGVTFDRSTQSFSEYKNVNQEKSSWINGELFFDNLGMNEFFERLELHFGTSIRIENLDLDDEFIRAYYSSEKSLEDILNDISVVKGFQVKKLHKGYMISK